MFNREKKIIALVVIYVYIYLPIIRATDDSKYCFITITFHKLPRRGRSHVTHDCTSTSMNIPLRPHPPLPPHTHPMKTFQVIIASPVLEIDCYIINSYGNVLLKYNSVKNLADASKEYTSFVSRFTVLKLNPPLMGQLVTSPLHGAESIQTFGPRREKTCLRGLRKSEIQTSLLSDRD